MNSNTINLGIIYSFIFQVVSPLDWACVTTGDKQIASGLYFFFSAKNQKGATKVLCKLVSSRPLQRQRTRGRENE